MVALWRQVATVGASKGVVAENPLPEQSLVLSIDVDRGRLVSDEDAGKHKCCPERRDAA